AGRSRASAERHGRPTRPLACAWNRAHAPVQAVVATLIQEAGPDARPVESKRDELADVPLELVLTEQEVAELRAIGDNSGSMALKGATPDYEGEQRPDRWSMDDELAQVAERWSIDPDRDLRNVAEPVR